MAQPRICSPPRPPPRDDALQHFVPHSPSPSLPAGAPVRDRGSSGIGRTTGAASPPVNGGGGGSRGALQREPPVRCLNPRGEASPGGEGQEAKKMAVVLDVDHLIPPPCVGAPTAASRVSPGSSPARSDASEGAAAADEPEASAGRSRKILFAVAAIGGRGTPYGLRPWSSYGNCAGSLTAHRSASSSSSSLVTSLQEQERAIDAVNEWRLPEVSEEEDEAVDQKNWQDDTMSCRVSSACDWNFESDSAYEGSNHDRSSDHSEVEDCAAAVQRMERQLWGSAMKSEENIVHDKLVAWEDAPITKLIHK